jgi:hypothetical protein
VLPDDIGQLELQLFVIELTANNFVCEIENFENGRFNDSRPKHLIGFVPRITKPPMSQIRPVLQTQNSAALAAIRYLPKEILLT